MIDMQFFSLLDKLGEYFLHKVNDAQRAILWNTIQHWSDDEINAARKCIEQEEKFFPKLATWNKYRNDFRNGKLKSTQSSDSFMPRTQFYWVNDCPRCGYGTAVSWNERFDRFTEYIHKTCKFPSSKRWMAMKTNETDYMKNPPAPIDIYPISGREEMRPIFGSTASSDDGRHHDTVQAAETVDLPF